MGFPPGDRRYHYNSIKNRAPKCTFLIFRCDFSTNDEIGTKAGVLLNVISALVEHNRYLQDYLCRNIRMKLNGDAFFDKFQNSVRKQYGHDFLNKIVQIVKLTGEIVSFSCVYILEPFHFTKIHKICSPPILGSIFINLWQICT